MWSATVRPSFAAACSTIGKRSFSGESKPHHETTTVPIPAAAISRICAATIFALDEPVRPAPVLRRVGVPRVVKDRSSLVAELLVGPGGGHQDAARDDRRSND